MIYHQKVEAIAEKLWRNRGGSSLLIENYGYYDSKTSADPDYKHGLNSLKNEWNWKLSWPLNELIESSVEDAQ